MINIPLPYRNHNLKGENMLYICPCNVYHGNKGYQDIDWTEISIGNPYNKEMVYFSKKDASIGLPIELARNISVKTSDEI
jgi:hypothetical protein